MLYTWDIQYSYIDLIVQLRHCSCSCTYFSVRVCFTCCSTTLYIVRTTLLHKSTTTTSVIIWDQRSYSPETHCKSKLLSPLWWEFMTNIFVLEFHIYYSIQSCNISSSIVADFLYQKDWIWEKNQNGLNTYYSIEKHAICMSFVSMRESYFVITDHNDYI